MGTVFLQEIDASIVVADVRDFSPLAQQLGPVELGLALGRFYEHIGTAVEAHHGRVVKFVGDGVLAAFFGSHHPLHALQAVAAVLAKRQAFLDDNTQRHLPILDYGIGVASGQILAGELGTDQLRFYDVLGQPVSQAFRLSALANRRQVTNLIDQPTWEGAQAGESRPPGIETDAVELGAHKLRLFKLEG